MSISNKTVSTLLLIVFLAALSPAEDPVLELAGKLSDTGYHFDAVTEYMRFIFFQSGRDESRISSAYYRMALSEARMLHWGRSREALDQSIQWSRNQGERDQRRMELALLFLANSQFSGADLILSKLEYFSTDSETCNRARFFLGVSAVYQFRWQQAKEYFAQYFKEAPKRADNLAEQVDSLLEKARAHHEKSPKLAKTLSFILPGSGQIYSGDWASGINALIVNGAILYYIFTDLQNKQILSIVLNSIFLFYRYYSGNFHNAEEAAKQYNDKQNRKWADAVLSLLAEKIE